MIANQVPCLKTEALADLLAGRLPADRFTEALEHVETCDHCTRAAETLSQEEPSHWVKRALHGAEAPLYDHEPECQAVMGSLLLQASTLGKSHSKSMLPIATLGPYRLLNWIGAGGMGSVYMAEHRRLKRMAAIKLLPREKSLQPGWLDRFNREMTSVAALEHPHVVRAIDAGEDGPWHYLVMEYLDGADLSQVCRRMGELPLRTSCELIRQAALGLDAIHSLGMTHRDIKPSNLFLTRAGVVKLLDLGLVLSGDSPLAADERLTTVGHLMGTLPYMAPEQLKDASSVDWRADLYSLGATLFRLLTGRPPHGKTKNFAMAVQIISNGPCPSIATVRNDLPDELVQLLDRMLSHDPAIRPKSALEVAKSLTPFCDDSAPKGLIRMAMQTKERGEGEPSGLLYSGSRPPNSSAKDVTVESRANGRKPRWPKWIVAGMAPLAFLAGIYLTIATDQGTLIIESDEPGVSVRVSQEDKVIESMRVEQSAKSLRLQSGVYRIELSGVENDGLVLSDSKVFLMRGDRKIVTIHRNTNELLSTPDGEVLSSERFYQGKTFDEWKVILQKERDVASIAQAMQALQRLAETDAEKATAARLCLLPARQLGGLVISGRPQSGVPAHHSGWFMTELADVYGGFLPEPGLTAMIEEFETGNKQSVSACFLLLGRFESEAVGQPGTRVQWTFPEFVQELVKTQDGREKAKRLESSMSKWFSRETLLDDPLSHSITLQRVMVLDVLGRSLAEDTQVVELAERLTKLADDVIVNGEHISQQLKGGMGGVSNPNYRGVSLGRSPISAWEAFVFSRALDRLPKISILLGLLEPTHILGAEREKQLFEAFERYAEENPRETAKAVVIHLERLETFGHSRVMGGGLDTRRSEQDTRPQVAKALLMTQSIDLPNVIESIEKGITTPDPGCLFSLEELKDLQRRLKQKLTP
ncbi:Serine/threonine-protein kinase PrkC [Pirellula sp. SH-Sr6A]|uniref:serine/threonine protein kinase n=1 Tax=Pirellula sp. SH-Sr6A TaxID=1632865 RepID=UPI00078C8E72|nr:serine/threonine-protein kinase [Pirellula sp. SH-Sr6A]AMV33430.1 Serine/threonine-protein kinase PrkC [Pirellula sp. SH-Sr6A]